MASKKKEQNYEPVDLDEFQDLIAAGDPIKPTEEGTTFLVTAGPMRGFRNGDKDEPYYYLDTVRIEGGKLADIPARWFLNQTTHRELANLIREDGDPKGKAYTLTGTPVEALVFREMRTVFQDVKLARAKKFDKLAEHASIEA